MGRRSATNRLRAARRGNRVTSSVDAAFAGVPVTRGTYGYYSVRSNRASQAGLHHRGQREHNNLGFFIQDAWTINNKLTINAGIRTEREKYRTYASGPNSIHHLRRTASSSALPTSSRRAPGFAYDVNGNGKWKVAGSSGIFYDILRPNCRAARSVATSGSNTLHARYLRTTRRWWMRQLPAACPARCRGPIDFRHPRSGPTRSTRT